MDETANAKNPHEGTPNRFFRWLRGLGIVRQTQDRWFTGLASGIAVKAGIDPLIVRGIFVVLAVLGGPGILLYVLGWFFIPDERSKIHAEELVRGRATPGVIVAAVIIAVWLISGMFRWSVFSVFEWDVWHAFGLPGWLNATFSWVLWAAVSVGVAYLLYRIFSRDHSDRSAAATVAAETHADGENVTAAPVTTPPVSTPPGPERPRPSKAYTLITLALALLAAGIAAGWVHLNGVTTERGGILSTSPAAIAALLATTGVFALALIVAGVSGTRAAGVGSLGFFAGLALLVTTALPWGTSIGPFVQHHPENAPHSAVATIGDSTIDLRKYDDRPERRTVQVDQFAGDITLILPQERTAHINMKLTAGTMQVTSGAKVANDLDWQGQTGVLHSRSFTVNEGGSGPPLTVNVSLFAGDITIVQAPSMSLKDAS